MKDAIFYIHKDNHIECQLCPHHCKLKDGQIGRCKVRQVKDNRLYSLNYGKITALQVDPIEKKPIINWMQGSEILSIGSYGCNLHCSFCQNYEISLEQPETVQMTPEEIVAKAIYYKLPSIAYTYNEPTIFYEMMLDTAKLAHEKGLKNVMVTNGFIEAKPLQHILPYMDVMNIDLKTYCDATYKALGGTNVKQILETIKIASKACHVETSLLIVPGVSDNVEKIGQLFERLSQINADLTLHISRYFPRYQYDEPATDVKVLMAIREKALKFFQDENVYLGNVR